MHFYLVLHTDLGILRSQCVFNLVLHADLGILRSQCVFILFCTQTLEYRDYSAQGRQSKGMLGRMATDLVLLCIILAYPFAAISDVLRSKKVGLHQSCLCVCVCV